MSLVFDPTIVYLILILGLWMGATAVYTPGTGVVEIAGLGVLGFAVWALFNMPTNWVGLVLIVLGVAGFVVIPFVKFQYVRYAEAGLILQGIGGFFLFNGPRPSLLIILLTIGLAFAYNRFVLVPLLEVMRQKPAAGDEVSDLLGARGRVVAPVNPPNTGTAQINGELWTIRSSVPLERGDIVQVLDVIGLELQVEQVKAKRAPVPNGHQPEEKVQE